jgi:hypothetical protein
VLPAVDDPVELVALLVLSELGAVWLRVPDPLG